MSKIRTYMRRLKNMSFQRMNNQIAMIHRETGKSGAGIFCDMLWCSVRYGVGYLDYHVFGFARHRGAVRNTYMTMNDNLSFVRRLNTKTYFCIFEDKAIFNRTFNRFIRRSWIDLRRCDEKALEQLCSGVGAVFAKPVDECGGCGVRRIVTANISDYGELYSELCVNRQYLVEQEIVQHPDMVRLYPNSVNTLRVVTVLDDMGNANIMYTLLRIGQGGSCVDNISSGGMYTAVLNGGQLKGPAFCDRTGKYYDAHPDTGVEFSSFVVPYYQSACEMCRSAAEIEPHMRYIGWDIAISPDGPLLIEGNSIPGYDMCQNSAHRDRGILPEFRAVVDPERIATSVATQK